MRPYGTQKQLEQRRRKAIGLARRGFDNATIARRLGTTPQSVGRWREAYERGGDAALTAKPVPGRPSRLNRRQKRHLIGQLLKGPLAHGFATDLWTCPRIAQLIRRRYGVRYHVDHIPRLLAALALSCQKPERQSSERDDEAIRRWIAKDWPRIKKRRTKPSPYRFHR